MQILKRDKHQSCFLLPVGSHIIDKLSSSLAFTVRAAHNHIDHALILLMYMWVFCFEKALVSDCAGIDILVPTPTKALPLQQVQKLICLLQTNTFT